MHQIELESLTFQNFIQSLWDKKVLLKKEKQILPGLPTALQTESSRIISDFCHITNTKILCKHFFNSLTLCSSITLKKIIQLLVMMTESILATEAKF